MIRGNLLVVPISQSVMYFEPLYLQAEQSPIPELTRVIVGYGDQVVMEPTLGEAFAKIFGEPIGRVDRPPAGGTTTTTPGGTTTTTAQQYDHDDAGRHDYHPVERRDRSDRAGQLCYTSRPSKPSGEATGPSTGGRSTRWGWCWRRWQRWSSAETVAEPHPGIRWRVCADDGFRQYVCRKNR